MLTIEQTLAYWERQHSSENALGAGGVSALTAAENQIFDASRLGALVDLVGHWTSPTAPLFVLDAGCGRGWAAEALARCGHAVTAFDASASAIEHCRRTGTARYEQASLDTFTCPWLFDVVCAIDVLFHVVADADWERSLRNLASFVQFAGRLVVTDAAAASRSADGDYTVHRGRDEYVDVLSSEGLHWTGFRPYAGRSGDKGFHTFRRAA